MMQLSDYLRSSPGRNATAGEVELVRRIGEACAEQMRARLLRRHGWTLFDVSFATDHAHRRLLIGGRVLLRRFAFELADELRAALGSRWRVRVGMRAADDRWQSRSPVTTVTQVWREWPGANAALSLATELLPADGAVQVLATTKAATLIRASDGTIGWILDPPRGPLRETLPVRRREPRAAGADRWLHAARSYLDTPYVLGGATRGGIDCSGLVQRLYSEVGGVLLPRHSTDQYRALRRLPRGPSPRAGALAFVSAPDGDSLHVGVMVRTESRDWRVVHASSTRGKVVEDPLEQYLANPGAITV
jgi:cell wall-associated NlpC family hydrolase